MLSSLYEYKCVCSEIEEEDVKVYKKASGVGEKMFRCVDNNRTTCTPPSISLKIFNELGG
jgi:hypothetical protein